MSAIDLFGYYNDMINHFYGNYKDFDWSKNAKKILDELDKHYVNQKTGEITYDYEGEVKEDYEVIAQDIIGWLRTLHEDINLTTDKLVELVSKLIRELERIKQ